MTLPVVWIPEAEADLKEALAWYEGIHPDLGARFGLGVDAAVEVIARSPLAFQMVHAEIRRVGDKALSLRCFLQGRKQSHEIWATNIGKALIQKKHGRCRSAYERFALDAISWDRQLWDLMRVSSALRCAL